MMKEYTVRLLSVALVGMACISCGPTDEEPDETVFEIVETDNGKAFQAENDDEFNIALNECVGCAEVWTITRQDSSKIGLEGTYSRGRSCNDCVGGTVTRVFRFKCLHAGQSHLELGYFEDTLNVTINIQ